MKSRIASTLLACLLLLISLPLLSSCSVLTPGNVGWFCESDGDCNDDMTCETYRYQGSDHKNKLCTGDKLLEDSDQNYGWIILVFGWLFLVVMPLGVAVLIIVGKIKNRGQPPAPES